MTTQHRALTHRGEILITQQGIAMIGQAADTHPSLTHPTDPPLPGARPTTSAALLAPRDYMTRARPPSDQATHNHSTRSHQVGACPSRAKQLR
jgi:hypothetical protein